MQCVYDNFPVERCLQISFTFIETINKCGYIKNNKIMIVNDSKMPPLKLSN